MNTKGDAPSSQEWKELYEAARDFMNLKPWTWMSDSNLFGIQNPENNEIGYCCIMGKLGEFFALAVYLGQEGLDGYLRIQSREIDIDDPDIMHVQKCLMASFEDRGDLEKEDYKTIKRLGLKFRGRKAWPRFRSYLPGYVPWFLIDKEVRFLTIALKQAVHVAMRLKMDKDLLTPPKENQLLVRVPNYSEKLAKWADEWVELLPFERSEFVASPLDEVHLQRIKKNLKKKQGTWEIDFFYFPGAIQEGGRPYHPRASVIMDHESELALHQWIAPPWGFFDSFQENILNFFEEFKILPQHILVNKDETFKMLEPITSRLNISLEPVDVLEAAEEFKWEMYDLFLGEEAIWSGEN